MNRNHCSWWPEDRLGGRAIFLGSSEPIVGQGAPGGTNPFVSGPWLRLACDS
ncbi:hypothetical protein C8R44DRAFT_227616 [Mycena epipterygia]|nr:hypothetical protein C8R44DRAFT_227616 [Mycena epipterygia]